MSYAERPAPDPERLVAALHDWTTDAATPGTTMAALKRGGLPELLADSLLALDQAGAATERAARVLDVWNRWERGEQPPAAALQALDEAGLADMLTAAAEARREAFGPAS